MSEPQSNGAAPVQEQAEAIVTQGQDVRARISRLFTQTAAKVHLDREGLIGMARSILTGAAQAADRAVGHDPGSVLRQVVDGLGDGLSAAALACRLTFEEAQAQGRSFAAEDLAKMRTDLKTVAEMFVDTVANTGVKFQSLAAGQLHALRAHAEKAKDRILPGITSALVAAGEHPVQFTSESAKAGLDVSRQALGGLFAAVGRRLQQAGERLSGGERTS